jgi:hypothetical protein
MYYTDEETRPLTLLQNWNSTYNLRKVTSDDAKSMCYLRVSEVKNGERVSRWKLGGINEYGNNALMETFREAIAVVRDEVENGIDRDNVTQVLGLLMVSHGEGRYGTEHPDTGEPCLFSDLPEKYQREVIEKATAKELEAIRMASVPCRVVNIISLSGLLGEVTMFSPDGEPNTEVIEQWTGELGEDGVSCNGVIDEVLTKTMMLLTMLSDVAKNGYDMSPAGLMDYAMNEMRSGRESANDVMALVLKMIAFALENDALDLAPGTDEDDD